MSGKLLVFNPEHDYAFANHTPYYIPPASIRRLGVEMELLPLLWASEGDYILKADNICYDVKKECTCSLESIINDIRKIEPWGWDLKIVGRLRSLGVPSALIPENNEIEKMRRMSHRRISIVANTFLHSPIIPTEIFTVGEGRDYCESNPGCYFKLPWSSGGRGVLATRELTSTQVEQWVWGGIKKQGSVIAEPFIDKKIDFATLWKIVDSVPHFEGLSLSLSDGRGKYDGNLYGEQAVVENYIRKHSISDLSYIIERQKDFLKNNIASEYTGRLGIDMIIDKRGIIYPCIEINLRNTMGHVALQYANLSSEQKKKKPVFKSLLQPLTILK